MNVFRTDLKKKLAKALFTVDFRKNTKEEKYNTHKILQFEKIYGDTRGYINLVSTDSFILYVDSISALYPFDGRLTLKTARELLKFLEVNKSKAIQIINNQSEKESNKVPSIKINTTNDNLLQWRFLETKDYITNFSVETKHLKSLVSRMKTIQKTYKSLLKTFTIEDQTVINLIKIKMEDDYLKVTNGLYEFENLPKYEILIPCNIKTRIMEPIILNLNYLKKILYYQKSPVLNFASAVEKYRFFRVHNTITEFFYFIGSQINY